MQSSRGLCYSSWEKRKVAYFLPAQLTENVANLVLIKIQSWNASWRWMAIVKCSKNMETPSLDSYIQSIGHPSLNMKEQQSSLWGAWLQTLWHSQMWWVHWATWYQTWGMEMYFFSHATAFPTYFRKKHIQDTSKRSLVLASRGKKKKKQQPNMSPHSFTVSQLEVFPFPNHTVLQNLQSNHKNWQTGKYLQHYKLNCLRDLNI